MPTEEKKLRVLTGLRPTGDIHLGNYFGALKPIIDLQAKHDKVFLFVADMHALDVGNNAVDFRRRSLELAAAFLALGFDLEKGYLYCQSFLPGLHELAWLLSCQVPYGAMLRATSFKDAQAKGKEVNMCLFNYPLLMAADILFPRADLVPVGKDQKQHLEMARDFAIRMNSHYGTAVLGKAKYGNALLQVPEPLISEEVGVIPGVDGEKMSKSKNNVIALFASDKVWKTQVMSIVTDSKGLLDKKDPEACNVFNIYKHLASPEEAVAMAEKYRAGGYGYGHAKQALLEKLIARFSPARDEYERWLAREGEIISLLKDGSRKVAATGETTVRDLKAAIGLL